MIYEVALKQKASSLWPTSCPDNGYGLSWHFVVELGVGKVALGLRGKRGGRNQRKGGGKQQGASLHG